MKNRLSDLTNHLFAQLERLSAEDMSPEQIEAETKRADAIVSVSDQVIRNGTLQLKAAELFGQHGTAILPMLPRIGGKEEAE